MKTGKMVLTAIMLAGAFSMFAGKTEFKFNKPAVKAADGSYTLSAGMHVFSENRIAIPNVNAVTTFSYEIKALPGAPKGTTGYIGFSAFDKAGKPIEIYHVSPVKGTETELAAPCKKADKIIKVKDGSKLKMNHCIAYNAKADLSDLPNRTANRQIVVKSAVKKGDLWEVTLSKPCGVDFPAGTKIRNHADGWYQYIICGKKLPSEWTPVKVKIQGSVIGNPSTKWTYGTAAVKVIVFTTCKRSATPAIAFRNLTIETADK